MLEEGKLVMTTVTGVLTEEDPLAHETALVNDPAIKPGFRELFDTRRVTLIQITEETIKKVAEIDKKAPSKMSSSRCAVVANDEDAFRWQKLFFSGSSQTIIFFLTSILQKPGSESEVRRTNHSLIWTCQY
jgi:hypothetical protein